MSDILYKGYRLSLWSKGEAHAVAGGSIHYKAKTVEGLKSIIDNVTKGEKKECDRCKGKRNLFRNRDGIWLCEKCQDEISEMCWEHQEKWG